MLPADLRSHRLARLWRSWLRSESPRRPVLRWNRLQKATLLILCVLVALVSSWPWLVEPDLRPGLAAPFDAVAPKNARVVDSEALEQRRSSLGSSTVVQVLDPQENEQIRMRLERHLSELERVAKSNDAERIGPVNLSPDEQLWLENRTQDERRDWDMVLRRALDRMLSQGLVNTLAQEQLRRASDLQLEDLNTVSKPGRSLGSKVLTTTLQGASNLQTDPVRSQRLIEDLITQQGIPTIEVNRGDLITRKGESISSQAYDVLDFFGMVNRRPKLGIWITRFTEALASCGVLLLVMRRERPCLEAPHGLLALGLLLLSQACKLWFGASVSPLAVIVPPTLLLAQGLGTTCALAWMAVASLLWPTPVTGLGEGRLLIAAATATVAALQAGRLRSRAQLLQLAVLLPVGAWLAELVLMSRDGQPLAGTWIRLPSDAGELASEALLLGLAMMLTILIIPLLESSFGLLTRARLMELADQERPLLRRLSSEAPGTFEHTLMICGLAEEGARSIGADVDLIRTGSLYHDVGKLHAPNWFIENQTSGENPHTQLNDPLASAGVLQAHVDEGLKLARRHRLPRPIADFIPEHQGTLRMGYFLHQARQQNPHISEKRFRYHGPTPRSKETGIMMLADGCEAALRSLPPDTSDQEARDTVKRIVEARISDGQLSQSSLSRAELELVMQSFVRVWRRMRHRRIPYPIPAKRSFSA
ncbi:7TM-HD extracellular [Synechococcus sp. MIT S9509]|uniref:HDIG domain-containing metalloprotein n=1 Tax=unclassified Synechococcus TaxID=2626047 RepID=UPI0007BBB490|nr:MULTISPECIES: HDIG domain-containing metalloprotein [unclassified Synechococcus]KZR85181.1 7TM-HD extracellular [Synechococcus sp. MIT S9504]KZR91286.1 7TM-HD extracellular [Synechococcus sp. MIT S9509]